MRLASEHTLNVIDWPTVLGFFSVVQLELDGRADINFTPKPLLDLLFKVVMPLLLSTLQICAKCAMMESGAKCWG